MRTEAKEVWLAAGMDLLAQQGPDAITLEALCLHLGLTKGSFYHHFGSRKVYTKALLEYWSERHTERFIAESEKGRTVAAKLRRLMEMIVALSPAHEALIRAWALRDPEVMRVQQRVDRVRMEYVAGLYEQQLRNRREAQRAARVVFSFFVGTQVLLPRPAPGELRAMFRRLARLYAPTPGRHVRPD